MARKTKNKTSQTKDQVAKDLQSSILKSSPAANLQKNTQFAGQMSTTIGSMIQNLIIDSNIEFSDDQRKIFEDMLEALKKMATSQDDTGKDREELRVMFAKMVVQSEKQTEKIEKEIIEKDKAVESKTEEVRYLKHWQEKAKEDTTLTEKEKENITKDLEAREKELEKLSVEKEKLTKSLEGQKKLGEEAKKSMQEPSEKRISLMDAFKADISDNLRSLAPGLDFNPKEGESYKDMLKGNLKSMTSVDGFKKAFGTKLLEPGKKAPTNQQLIDAEREADNQQQLKDSLQADAAMEDADIQSLSGTDAEGIGEATASNTDNILSSLLQEVSVIRKLVEGSIKYDPTKKEGQKYGVATGNANKEGDPTYSHVGVSKEQIRTSGTGLFTKDELNEQLGLSSTEFKKTDVKAMEKMAMEDGRIAPLEADRRAEEEDEETEEGEIRGGLEAPVEVLQQLEEQGKISNDLLKSLVDIGKRTEEFQEERDREEDANQSTVSADEIKGEVASDEKSISSSLTPSTSDKDESGGGGGGGIMDMIGGGRGGRGRGMGRGVLGGAARGVAGGVVGGVAGKASKGVAAKLGGKAAGKIATKAIGKSLLKKIPGIGLVAGLAFGANRLMSGDWKGALGEVASGAASTVPGLGTAASVAIDAGLAARDASKPNQLEGGIEGSPDSMAGALDEATENAAPRPITMPNSPGNTINNTSVKNGGETPPQGSTSIRIQDNSFIRFQDKRVARV